MTAPRLTIEKNTVSLPTNLELTRKQLDEALTIIERDIHQRVNRGKKLDGSAQTKNAPQTLEFKRERGLGRTPLKMGWTPFGFNRFLEKFPRRYGRGVAVMSLSSTKAPGGFPSAKEVAGYLRDGVKRRSKLFKGSGGRTTGGTMTRTRYEVPFGISDRAGTRVAKRINTLLRRQIAKQARRTRGRSR